LGWIAQQGGDVRLAEENPARCLEPGRDRAVLIGRVIERGESAGGANALGSVGVFQSEGHAVQGPPHFPPRHRLVGFPRAPHRAFGVDGDDGVEAGIVPVDLRQVGGQGLLGGDGTDPDGGR
jgi:hypothetical protein